MGNAYTADIDLLTANDDGSIPVERRSQLVVHTFEGRDLSADDMARYQQRPEAAGSYHMVIDAAGRTARENDDLFIPWAAGPTGNRVGFHFSLAGQAAFSRDTWLGRTAQLDKLAEVLAAYSRAYSIPLEHLTVQAVRDRARGVTSHADQAQAWRETDHTDPGPAFPWDVVLDRAKGGTPAPDAQPGCFHVVAKGETLTRIAERYSTTVAALAEANDIPDPNVIHAGAFLRIP